MRRLLFTALALLSVSTLWADGPRFQPRRGINLSHWFAQSGTYDAKHLATHTTKEDFARIRALGFDHVRFTVDAAPLWDREAAAFRADHLRRFDAALDGLLAAGLNVIVDIHPGQNRVAPFTADEESVRVFVAFWSDLSRHLSRRDPDRVALEILNEPQVQDPARWQAIVERVAKAIRAAAPEHTIVVCGPKWSSVDTLPDLKPLADPNVLYTFHFYEPFAFTHQGANWTSAEWAALRNVPYPSTPERVQPLLKDLSNPQSRRNLEWYGRQEWNAGKVEAELGRAADWAKRHGVTVYCGEFGVYRKFSPPEDRAAYLRDVRRALEKHGTGWAMWDYRGGFSLVEVSGDRREVDRPTAAALGLKIPEAR